MKKHDDYWDTAGKPIKFGKVEYIDKDITDYPDWKPDPNRPKLYYSKQAHSILVVVNNKRYWYNIYDIPMI